MQVMVRRMVIMMVFSTGPISKKLISIRKKKTSVYDTQKNFCVQLVRPPVFHQGGLGQFGEWFGGGPGGRWSGWGRS